MWRKQWFHRKPSGETVTVHEYESGDLPTSACVVFGGWKRSYEAVRKGAIKAGGTVIIIHEAENHLYFEGWILARYV